MSTDRPNLNFQRHCASLNVRLDLEAVAQLEAASMDARGLPRDHKEFALQGGPAASKRVPEDEGSRKRQRTERLQGPFAADATAAAFSGSGALAAGASARSL